MFQLLAKQSPARRIIFSFALVILIGSLLLNLPFLQLETSKASYIDHLFTAVSMVCVTGLFTTPVSETYNIMGQFICLLLIQIGGLGLLSFIGYFYVRTNQKLSLSSQATLRESLNHNEQNSMRDFIRSIFILTFLIEILGTIILSFRFVPLLGWGKGLFSSLFIAVSAFCNAGFDNLGSTSMLDYQTDPLVTLTIATLIIMGGLGFSVWFDLKSIGSKRRLRFHTKVVLTLTVSILALGTLLTFLTEYNNPETIGSLSFGDKILTSFFQTVSMRTAGFASIDYTKARPVTLLIYTIQMFLGGAPGGTAGGLKITTMLVIFVFARAEILGLPYANFRHHTIAPSTIQKSFSTFIIFNVTFLIGLTLLSLTTPNVRLIYLLFETMSALATVGVTANLTPTLSQAALIIVMMLMFIGRIGPFTLMVSLSNHKPKKKDMIKYAKANLTVG